ncbi:hypothetical protein [Roseovarius salis]|uniref:hypothetical protein n=1 Tax=Roseovarius salis TaxID=3376063 RepID=UPI0037CA79A2
MMPRLAIVLVVALAAPAARSDVSAPARDGTPRVWIALSGERLSLDGVEYRLRGVTCPNPGTMAGRQAKALLNTFLRGGHVVCDLRGTTASCAKEGRDAAAGLVASGLCEPRVAPEPPGAGRTVMRGGRVSPRRPDSATERRQACDPVGPGVRFRSVARAFACSAGVPFSLCEGVNGLRRAGRIVAPSGRYRATGDIAPSYRPFDCP